MLVTSDMPQALLDLFSQPLTEERREQIREYCAEYVVERLREVACANKIIPPMKMPPRPMVRDLPSFQELEEEPEGLELEPFYKQFMVPKHLTKGDDNAE